jgi:Lar family restriction alleviation protein
MRNDRLCPVLDDTWIKQDNFHGWRAFVLLAENEPPNNDFVDFQYIKMDENTPRPIRRLYKQKGADMFPQWQPDIPDGRIVAAKVDTERGAIAWHVPADIPRLSEYSSAGEAQSEGKDQMTHATTDDGGGDLMTTTPIDPDRQPEAQRALETALASTIRGYLDGGLATERVAPAVGEALAELGVTEAGPDEARVAARLDATLNRWAGADDGHSSSPQWVVREDRKAVLAARDEIQRLAHEWHVMAARLAGLAETRAAGDGAESRAQQLKRALHEVRDHCQYHIDHDVSGAALADDSGSGGESDSGEDELKPCPFCGSDKLGHYAIHASDFVQCESCEAVGPDQDDCGSARDKWNTRAHTSCCHRVYVDAYERAAQEIERESETCSDPRSLAAVVRDLKHHTPTDAALKAKAYADAQDAPEGGGNG